MASDDDELLLTLEQKVHPRHSALILVDVQNDFVAEGGFFHRAGADVSRIQASISRLEPLLARARDAGLLVVFIQAIYDDHCLSGPMRERNRRQKLETPRCLTGSWGADFFSVRPKPGEPVVVKHRYSAFAGTDLNRILEQAGIKSLLLTGAATDVCVESTARDGYFLDYYITMVADCCGAASEQDHRGALARCERDFGTVASSREVLEAWARLGVASAV